MQIQENISLHKYNTFGIDVKAKHFVAVDSFAQMQEVLEWAHQRNEVSMLLGGGSNVLFTKDFDGLIIRNELRGIEKVKEDDEFVYIKAAAGEVWHEFVLYCLGNNYAGVENLALIPGFVGASLMQNIGAYGVEIKDVFYELTALHKFENKLQTFDNAECGFGYRESVFKNKYKDQFAIMDVTYRLRKQPAFHTEYGAIRAELEKNNVKELSIQAIANAVVAIRTAKLPNPKDIGNAGSFFKNPSVPWEHFSHLKEKYPDMPSFENADGSVKIPAGWLIEQCGYKGYTKGQVGVHKNQALVLVNHGHATGVEVLQLCYDIKFAVLDKFGIPIMPEVNIV
ncbi:MAG: UDP-N-acetylmuramate dehydrogenase [Niabella sp.]